MFFIGGGIARCIIRHHVRNGFHIVIINVDCRPIQIMQSAVKEHAAFAGVSQHQKFMAGIAAYRAGVCAHRHGFNAHASKGFQIAHKHFVVRMFARFNADVE